MRVKRIWKIKATGEFCVVEGTDMQISPQDVQRSTHVRILDAQLQVTDVTRNVPHDNLVVVLEWNGTKYVSSTNN